MSRKNGDQATRYVPAPKPANEAERLAELERLGIMDTGRASEFDQIVSAASEVCEAPTALLTLIDGERQWYKAAVGFDEPEAQRNDVICAYTLLDSKQPFILPDTLEHENIRLNPFVQNGARFYAGWPLVSGDGLAVGTLCVVGPEPQELSDGQVKVMGALAEAASKLLQARRSRLDLDEFLHADEQKVAEAIERVSEVAQVAEHGEAAISEVLDVLVECLDIESAVYWRVTASEAESIQLWSGNTAAAARHATVVREFTEPPELVVRARMAAKTMHSKDERGYDVYASPIWDGPGPAGVVALHMGRASISPVPRMKSALGTVTGHLSRIFDRERDNTEMLWQAKHDSLTGLASRSVFEQELRDLFDQGLASDISVAFVDLDQFKLINDSLGHRAGDELLQLVAERMSLSVEPGDMLARFGGDEFVLLMHGDSQRSTAMASTKQVIDSLAAPFQVTDQEIFLGASAGVALGSDHDEMQELLSAADSAKFRAKRNGRDIEFSDSLSVEQARETLSLKSSLLRALEQDKLDVAFQPVVATEGGEVEFFEVLCRWNRPDGPVSPGIFIPMAEQTGLIPELDRWVRGAALAAMRQWDREGGPLAGCRISVNVSINELVEGFSRAVEWQLKTAGISPDRVIIEVTESLLLDSNAAALAEVEQLASMGFPIAVDDFGSGYSSLRRLRDLPANYLKVDSSLLPQDVDDTDFLTGVMALAKSLHQTLVVEGVETAEQLSALKAAEIPLCQGYFFARPTNAAGVHRWMQAS